MKTLSRWQIYCFQIFARRTSKDTGLGTQSQETVSREQQGRDGDEEWGGSDVLSASAEHMAWHTIQRGHWQDLVKENTQLLKDSASRCQSHPQSTTLFEELHLQMLLCLWEAGSLKGFGGHPFHFVLICSWPLRAGGTDAAMLGKDNTSDCMTISFLSHLWMWLVD